MRAKRGGELARGHAMKGERGEGAVGAREITGEDHGVEAGVAQRLHAGGDVGGKIGEGVGG